MVKKYVKLLFVMFCFGILVACSLTINTEDNESEAEKQSNSPGIEEEKDVEGNTKEVKNEKKEPESDETAVIENELEEQETDETVVPEDAPKEPDTREVVAQNDAFKVFEPAPGTEVKGQIVVKGLARVFEGTIQYEFEDGHFILDEGFTTASEGAPGWGEFEIIIELDEVSNYSGTVILYEESAKDGSKINELMIPVKVK